MKKRNINIELKKNNDIVLSYKIYGQTVYLCAPYPCGPLGIGESFIYQKRLVSGAINSIVSEIICLEKYGKKIRYDDDGTIDQEKLNKLIDKRKKYYTKKERGSYNFSLTLVGKKSNPVVSEILWENVLGTLFK